MNTDAARKLALELMATHLDGSWSFHWSNARSQFGRCNYTNRRIVLSRPLTEANAADQVRDTILHEIAHALTPPPAEAHGIEWKRTCLRIGAAPIARYDTRAVARAAAPPAGRWYGTCNGNCGRPPFTRLRLNKRVRDFGRCPGCSSTLTWERRTE